MDRIAPDQADRDRICSELDKTFLVEAGAGSGKTTNIIKRMVELVRQGKSPVDQIASVTFTRKAAGELRERFQIGLERAWQLATLPQEKQRLSDALLAIDGCFIGTIHSFCARLLRERPVEAGIHSEFCEVDDTANDQIKEQAWQGFLSEVQAENPLWLSELAAIGLAPNDLKLYYQTVCDYPDVTVQHEPRPRPDLSKARDAVVAWLKDVVRYLPPRQEMLNIGQVELQEVVCFIERYESVLHSSEDWRFIRLLEALEKDLKHQPYKFWGGRSEDAKNAKKLTEALRTTTVLPALQAWREYRHDAASRFACAAAAYCEKGRREQGLMNFQDLLMTTARLLRNSEVRRYFQQRFSYLLVDEFQDTDPIQAEIVMLLTGENTDEPDWTKQRPRPGSLFIVGDPKQSIYRFRRADIATYMQVKQMICRSGGEVLMLTANFRSGRLLGDWFNSVLPRWFPGAGSPYQADYAGINTMREDGVCSCEGVRKITVGKISDVTAGKIAAVEAARIAAWIDAAIRGAVVMSDGNAAKPGDFLILAPRRKFLSVYARALEAKGIPIKVTGGSSLADAEELVEFFKLLRYLADPDDPVKLLAVLRGIWFGFSDDDFYQFHQAGGKFYFRSSLADSIPADLAAQFTAAYERLQKWRKWLEHKSPALAVRMIGNEIGILPYAAAQLNGRSRSGYYLHVQEILKIAEYDEGTSFSGLIDRLSDILNQDLEQEMDQDGLAESAVRIMNLHKAKGLEAKIVFLVESSPRDSYDPVCHIHRGQEKASGYFLALIPNGPYHKKTVAQPADWQQYAEEESKYLSAEQDRLRYVAITRAQHLLVVCTYPDRAGKSYWGDLDSALNAVEELANLTASDAAQATVVAESSAIETDNEVGCREQELQAIRSRLAELTAMSYQSASATDLLKDHDNSLHKHATGKGKSWGTVVHNFLAWYMKNPTGDLTAAGIVFLQQENRQETELTDLLDDIATVCSREEWQQAKSSPLCLVEVPIRGTLTADEQKAAGLANVSGDLVVNGIIDLIYKQGKQWILVDYKTDKFATEVEKEALTAHYTRQLAIYRYLWEKASGETIAEAKLLWVSKPL